MPYYRRNVVPFQPFMFNRLSRRFQTLRSPGLGYGDASTLPLDSGDLYNPTFVDAFDPNYPGYFNPTGTVVGSIEQTVQNTINSGLATLDTAIRNAIGGNSPGSTSVDPVPVQNQITATVLAPVSAALQMQQVLASAPSLQALYTFLVTGEQRWLQFIQQYPSARATAAQQTLAPYFSGLKTRIQSELAKFGQSPTGTPGGTIPGTNIPLPTPSTGILAGGGLGLLALGGLAWFLLRR